MCAGLNWCIKGQPEFSAKTSEFSSLSHHISHLALDPLGLSKHLFALVHAELSTISAEDVPVTDKVLLSGCPPDLSLCLTQPSIMFAFLVPFLFP